ncbi:MAG: sigma 54-interacting transcriptional regulator [bacterium]
MTTDPAVNEAERLAALQRYGLLDTPPEQPFEHIVAIAAQLFGVPVALIGLVAADRVWFKARHGLAAPQIGREPGFCASAIHRPNVLHVRDARHDPRTAEHPWVTGEPRVRFYAGAPLRTPNGLGLGTLCILDRQPRDLTVTEAEHLERLASLVGEQMEMRLASRTIAELQSVERRMSEELREANRRLTESEERFRDLFDEAPIAYVHEGLDTRFIRANKTAMRILGLTADQVEGTYGKSLIPDTPDAQRRVQAALESIGRGADTSGVVLELRRRDDGRPIWIQWWSRPDPSGQFTRTMFLDVTEHMQMSAEKERLEAQNLYLREEIRDEHDVQEIVGASPSLLAVLRQVDQVAATDSTVLITGETGTGKELIARAIHERSHRKREALVKVNCGAISAGLVESELFGHVKGAFTGALAHRDGRFKTADGGTLFLDEVGELPLDTQVKLLRVLQEQEFEPIGSNQSVRVNVRIIAATNRDLALACREGRFRSDLFYRLNVVPIAVPPLSERGPDLPLLIAFFLERAARKLAKPAMQLSEAAMQRLVQYRWPGNVRELENVIERAVVLSSKRTLDVGDVLAPIDDPAAAPSAAAPIALTRPAALAEESASPVQSPQDHDGIATRTGSLDAALREHIEAALTRARWMIEGPGGAAEILKLNPSTLRSKMKKLGIRRPAES